MDYNVPGGGTLEFMLKFMLSCISVCFDYCSLEYFGKRNLIPLNMIITYITGKLNRGLSVIDSYKLLKGGELSEEEFFLTSTLGWCIEWV